MVLKEQASEIALLMTRQMGNLFGKNILEKIFKEKE